ncbi:MAG: DUF2177 family protein [Candidatus Paceibacteria bacterium]
MNIQLFFTLYAISVPIFFLIDMLWLGLIARGFYQDKLGHLMGDVNWIAAIIFYLVFLLGLTYFAIYPSVVSSSFLAAITLGALFGFFTYATYDLTNFATLRDWPLSVVLVDILWGTILGMSVTCGTYLIYMSLWG